MKALIEQLRKLKCLILAARVEETEVENFSRQLEQALAKLPNRDWTVAADVRGLKIKVTNKGGYTKTTYIINLLNSHFTAALQIPQREVVTRIKADDKDLVGKMVTALVQFQERYAK